MPSPIVTSRQVTFRFTDDATKVDVASDSTDWQPVEMNRRVAGWSLTRPLPHDAREEYLFLVDGRWTLDLDNPLRAAGGFGPRSEVRMPGYPAQRPVELPVDGKMERRRLGGRPVDIYVPLQTEGAAVLVVQDGWDYLWFTGLPGLLDSLIREGVIPPTLAVFVSPRDREDEYVAGDPYVQWLADRLIPALRGRYPIDPAPERHALLGASLGGLISTYAALCRPDAYRLIGAQSPAYLVWEGVERAMQAMGSELWPALRFHIDGGTFETVLHGKHFLCHVRAAVEQFRERGAAVRYSEVNEGHNWTNWRSRLPEMLIWLLAPSVDHTR